MEADDRFSFDSGESEEDMTTIFSNRDPVEIVKESLAYCFNNAVFAENYVDAIINESRMEFVRKPKTFKICDIVSPIVDELLSIACQSDVSTTPFTDPCLEHVRTRPFTTNQSGFSGWPKVSDFNIKLGLEKLEEYIESWQKSEEWMSCVEFLGFESEESSNYFVYEVEFSIPTPMYPIPQATASVYFSLEVSKIVPPPYDAPVQDAHVLIRLPRLSKRKARAEAPQLVQFFFRGEATRPVHCLRLPDEAAAIPD